MIDGNYTRSTSVKWKDVDTVIWLDLPFHLNLYQSIHRTMARLIFKKILWQDSNNTEKFSKLLSRDSIIWWMIKTYRENRGKYLAMMQHPDYAHIQFIRIRKRRDIENLSNGA